MIEETPHERSVAGVGLLTAAFALLLYGEFRLLEFIVRVLNRIPNLPKSQAADTLTYLYFGMVGVLALSLPLWRWKESERSLRRRCGACAWLLGCGVILGTMPLPLGLVAELLFYAGAAISAVILLRIPADAYSQRWPISLILSRSLLASTAALGFAGSGLLLAKRISMEFDVD